MLRRATLVSSAFALVFAFAGSARAVAACEPGRLPSREYLDVIALYESGDRALAVARLGGWGTSRLRADTDLLRDAATARAACLEAPASGGFELSTVRPAILLHLDREILENFREPVGETVPQCRSGENARIVRRLSAHLAGVDETAHQFLRWLFLGVARFSHWSHCLALAREWAREGTRLFPRDSQLWLTLGVIVEADGSSCRRLRRQRAAWAFDRRVSSSHARSGRASF